jgi:hypothetical protein
MTPHNWANRALNHARLITSASPGRGSATRLEAQAADYARHHLSNLGITNLRTQPFTGSRSIWFFLSLVFGIAVMGHLGFALLQPALGQWGAWAVSLVVFSFSFWLMWRKFSFREYPFEDLLPNGPSQNVIAVLPPSGDVHQQVVLLAHLDTHRAVIWFATDILVSLYSFLAPLVIFGILAAPLFYALSILTGLAVFVWLGIALAFLQFLAWFTGVTADLGVYSPGANDNAAALGSVLSLAERLQGEPLQHTQVTVLLTGCEETGCDGLRAFLDQAGHHYAEALFVNFELVGVGDRLVYLEREGVIRWRKMPPATAQLLHSLEGHEIQPASLGVSSTFTETGLLWGRGYQAACLMMQRSNNPLPAHWHRMTDTPDNLADTALQKTHDFAWALLQKIDQPVS